MFARKPKFVTAPPKRGGPIPVGQPPRTTRSKPAPADQPKRRIGLRAPKQK
ncbi:MULTISPECIES: hypothetical protein [unclassified Streptomyces]|uniref:hypothetical protein n=1 Tax=unclassified Streptomyces TaxID=2593676 RepID=UPI000AE2FF79|nr:MULTISPECIES: hypothetical protein [unclassified Streptomyces]